MNESNGNSGPRYRCSPRCAAGNLSPLESKVGHPGLAIRLALTRLLQLGSWKVTTFFLYFENFSPAPTNNSSYIGRVTSFYFVFVFVFVVCHWSSSEKWPFKRCVCVWSSSECMWIWSLRLFVWAWLNNTHTHTHTQRQRDRERERERERKGRERTLLCI